MIFENQDVLFCISKYVVVVPHINSYTNNKNIIDNSMINSLIAISKKKNVDLIKSYYPLNNYNFILKLVKLDGIMIKFADDKLKDNFKIAEQAIYNNPNSLYYCSNKVKDDINLVKLSLKNGGKLYYASQRLRSNKDFACYAIDINPQSCKYIMGDWYKDDILFTKWLINKHIAITTIFIIVNSNVFINDIELIKTAIKDVGYRALRSLPIDLKNRPDLKKICRKYHLQTHGHKNIYNLF